MASLGDGFDIYAFAAPPRINVYCAPGFRDETAALFYKHWPAAVASFANMNALIERFTQAEQLSEDAFRREGKEGWAFRAGRLRFYGMFSASHKDCFVLSHAIFKSQQKLDAKDLRRMIWCRDEFDKLIVLPNRARNELH